MTLVRVGLNKVKFHHVQGRAVHDLSKQLVNRGGKEENLGIAMLKGAIQGLKIAQKEKYPVCPFCGKRHPNK